MPARRTTAEASFGDRLNNKNSNNGKSRHYSTMVLLLLASIASMVMYIEAVAFPSLPMIMADFGLGEDQYGLASWIVTIYLVVGTVSIPVFGKLGDVYGKKKMLVVTMSIYSVMVTLTGFSRDFSDSIYVMIFLRAIQGIAFAMFPLAFSIVRDEFPKDRIAVAQGVISAMFGVGTAIGFVIGGYVTDVLGWEWTYHTAAPFAVVMTVLVFYKVRESPVRLKARVDYVGAALLGATLVTFLIGVTETSTRIDGVLRGWADPLVLVLLSSAAIFFVLFAFWLSRVKDPLIRPSLLRVRNLALMSVIAFLIGFGFFTAIQTVTGLAGFSFRMDAIEIGILLLPTSAVTLVLGPTVGMLVRNHGPKWPLALGMLLSIAGFIMLYFDHYTKMDIMLGATVMGAGQAFAMVSSINLVITSTPIEETGISTGVNTIIRNSGSVVGPAVSAVIIAQNSHFVPALGAVEIDDIAYKTIFVMASISMALGFIVALLVRNIKVLPESSKEPAAGALAQSPERK